MPTFHRGAYALLAVAFASPALAQTLVTYQGVLEDGGVPANGLYEITVEAYDDEFAGSQLDGQTFEDVTVIDGRFTVEINYLTDFAGLREEIWLELYVRPGGSTGLPTLLSPRQLVTAAPLAGHAARAGTVEHVLSSDIADGPGVAWHLAPDAGDGDLFSSYAVLAQQTIDCPASGYVLAIGLATFQMGGASGSSAFADLALSLDGSTPYQGRTWSHSLAFTGAGFLGSEWPGVAMQMIPVSAGITTVSLIARSTSGEDFEDSPALALVYIPTAYGPVQVENGGTPVPELQANPEAPAMRAVVGDEVADMRARLDRLERLVRAQQQEIERLRASD